MDAEITQLGPGAESADRPVRRADQQLSVKKGRDGRYQTSAIPGLFVRYLYDCQKTPGLFQKPGVPRGAGSGQSPQNQQ